MANSPTGHSATGHVRDRDLAQELDVNAGYVRIYRQRAVCALRDILLARQIEPDAGGAPISHHSWPVTTLRTAFRPVHRQRTRPNVRFI